MHSQQGIDLYLKAVSDAVDQGGKIEYGGKVSQAAIYATIL